MSASSARPVAFPAAPHPHPHPHLSLAGRPSVAAEPFRSAMGQLAGGVCVVTTADRSGARFGLTVTSVTSVSLDPPLLLVCIDARSRALAPLRAGGPLVVHMLSARQEGLARRFAGPAPDRFAGVASRTLPGGGPLLDGVLAAVECVVHRIVPGGDHEIVIGRVVGVHAGSPGPSSPPNPSPLLYVDRRYAAIARERGFSDG